LGLEVSNDVASDGFRWITVGAPGQDVDSTSERVRGSGAEVLQEPVAQPWGVRDCAFRDPSGNMVRIALA
jgi:catechol 2,3-dioxygenase-like lactoylglutathione lyase family enzyme